jgi:fructose transport system substrate-binding protein
LIGQWTAKKLAGKKATIALLDIFDDRIVSVDYCRDNGFLDGMGIDVKDPKVMGDEDKKGKYSGGDYEIVGNVATGANEEGGRTGLEKLLAKNKNINVVYTINEPTAIGACAAAAAAGVKIDAMVSVDGGGAGINAVKSGCINATSQQYPLLMADLGVQAIYDIVKNGTKPAPSEGLDFFNTGVKLITDDPQEGVPSETTEYGLANAWG